VNWIAAAFHTAINGADPDASLPAFNLAYPSGVPSVTISTANANDVILWICILQNVVEDKEVPLGFMGLTPQNIVNGGGGWPLFLSAGYKVVNSTQSSTTLTISHNGGPGYCGVVALRSP
jgi:hypothetical protein